MPTDKWFSLGSICHHQDTLVWNNKGSQLAFRGWKWSIHCWIHDRRFYQKFIYRSTCLWQGCKMDCEKLRICEIANCDCEKIAISQLTQFIFLSARRNRNITPIIWFIKLWLITNDSHSSFWKWIKKFSSRVDQKSKFVNAISERTSRSCANPGNPDQIIDSALKSDLLVMSLFMSF